MAPFALLLMAGGLALFWAPGGARLSPGRRAKGRSAGAGLRRLPGPGWNGRAAASSPAFPGTCPARPGGPEARSIPGRIAWSALWPELDHRRASAASAALCPRSRSAAGRAGSASASPAVGPGGPVRLRRHAAGGATRRAPPARRWCGSSRPISTRRTSGGPRTLDQIVETYVAAVARRAGQARAGRSSSGPRAPCRR